MLYFHPKCTKMRLAAGLHSDPLEELTMLPRPSTGFRGRGPGSNSTNGRGKEERGQSSQRCGKRKRGSRGGKERRIVPHQQLLDEPLNAHLMSTHLTVLLLTSELLSLNCLSPYRTCRHYYFSPASPLAQNRVIIVIVIVNVINL